LVGLVVGLVLVAVLIWIPGSRQGDVEWITDQFVYMGMPLIIICSAVGALVGAFWSTSDPSPDAVGPAVAAASPQPSSRRRVLVTLTSVAAIVLAIWVFLGATGMVPVSPLDLPWPVS
jgi:hypothetical protein